MASLFAECFDEFGELHQNVGHLVAALAATDVDHQIHVTPLGKLVLNNGLTASEGAGNAGSTAAGDGEERVNNSLACNKGLSGGDF